MRSPVSMSKHVDLGTDYVIKGRLFKCYKARLFEAAFDGIATFKVFILTLFPMPMHKSMRLITYFDLQQCVFLVQSYPSITSYQLD